MKPAADPKKGIVLVTGASGFLGSHVVTKLVAEGWRVRGLARSQAGAEKVRQLHAEVALGDMSDRDSLVAALDDVRAVVHCAALVSEWDSPQLFHEVNVLGMERLSLAALDAGVERFVEVSSVGVYGMRHHDNSDESAPLCLSGDPYADSKVRSEEIAWALHRDRGLPLVTLRPGVIYGPGDRNFMPRLLTALRSGQFAYVGGGHNIQTLIHVKDVASVVPMALTAPHAVGRAYNLVNTKQPTTRRFVETVAELIGVPLPTKSVSAFTAWSWCYAAEYWHRLFNPKVRPTVNRTSMRFAALSRAFSTQRATEELGFDPVNDLRVRIEETLLEGDYDATSIAAASASLT